ncbi:Ig-like domain-containing protein [Clostridium felsineum]|uniref:Ig-like domain-containing protein n=1 Tax=Clostridium felsineum TaxID=36839 RepID=UPI00214D9ADD|nr:Ig-like domain-containing protein [Clostridium felsineum]MCR3757911.1 Ig-like domain-containing protein [Clostridium felsineum]
MKLKKMFSTLLIAAFAFSFTTTNNISADTTPPTNTPQLDLTVTPNNDANCNDLKWNMSGASQDYSYKLYSKKSTDSQFQTTPCKGTTTDKVHVLNVYPDAGNNLKSWMEDPNPEDATGYGKGIITVTEIPLSTFNSNPNIKDSNGNEYDVIMFGSWDANNSEDLNATSEPVVESFIKSGRGVLFGHDTINQTYFSKLSNYANLNLKTNSNPYTGSANDNGRTLPASSTTSNLTKVKTGSLVNYPWTINNNLSVPVTHNSQLSYGDIWIRFTHKSYTADDMINPGNFYLSTWNNTAMIQTGHSNGQATSDEKKLLANTLIYLAQVTDQTSWEDHKGQDVDAPNKPVINSVTNDTSKNQISLDYSSTDNGSTYDYYVEATGKNDGTKVSSATKTETITTGINGYYIVVDQNPDTIPIPSNTTLTTTSTHYVINNSYKNDFYVHIAAIDKAGNISEVTHQKVQVQNATGITLNKNTDELITGQNDKLIATITPDDAIDKSVVWSTSDPSIASVDSNGTITAQNEGTATITATTADGKTASCVVTVTPNRDKARLSITMTNGQTETFITSMDIVNNFISWYKLKSTGVGQLDYIFNKLNASILKTEYISFDKISSFEVADFTKISPTNITRINLNKTTDKLKPGDSDVLSASVTPTDIASKGITWSSSDKTIADVDSTGKISALKDGTAIITAATADGKIAKCTITVDSTADTDIKTLSITMVNGQTREYEIPMYKINDFITWYNSKSTSVVEPFYTFNILNYFDSGIITTDYVISNQISSFDIYD